jgi:hypothetical protein
VGSVFETQSRYELLRHQALEPPSPAGGQGLELGFIEHQGLAAWLVQGPEGHAGKTVSVDSPTDARAEAQPPRGDMILVLSDLIMGDRREQCDG